MVEIFSTMPRTMRQLAWVQLFTWFGLFCMWIYFAVAVARSVFGATDEKSALFTEGVEWGGVCFSVYNAVCLVFSILLLKLARSFSPKAIHAICLAFGAVGLVSVAFMGDKYLLLVSMVGVGIAWASIVSMPYAMLSGALPEDKMGVYMGIFNFFIVIPQIIASVGLGWVMQHLLGNDRMLAVVVGGVSIGIAAILTLRVKTAQAA
jgi:maltose/moltooligosaccharide transporter